MKADFFSDCCHHHHKQQGLKVFFMKNLNVNSFVYYFQENRRLNYKGERERRRKLDIECQKCYYIIKL